MKKICFWGEKNKMKKILLIFLKRKICPYIPNLIIWILILLLIIGVGIYFKGYNNNDLLSYVGGVISSMITLYGVWWQVNREEKQKEKERMRSILKYLKYILEKNYENISKKNFIVSNYKILSYILKLTANENDIIENFEIIDVSFMEKIFFLNFDEDILFLNERFKIYNKARNAIYTDIDIRYKTIEELKKIDFQDEENKNIEELEKFKNSLMKVGTLSKLIYNYSITDDVQKYKNLPEVNYKKSYEKILKKFLVEDKYFETLNEEGQKIVIYSHLLHNEISKLRGATGNLLKKISIDKEEYSILEDSIKKMYSFIKLEQDMLSLKIYSLEKVLKRTIFKIKKELKKIN